MPKDKVKIFFVTMMAIISMMVLPSFSTSALAAPSPIVAVPFSPDDDLDNPALRMPAAALTADRLGAPARLEQIDLATMDSVAASVVSRLLALQSSTDAGWNEGNISALTAHSGGASPTNTYGVIAIGLLNAYKMFKNPAYLDAARRVGDKLKTFDYNAGQKLQAPDLVFLHYLSKETGDTSYKAKGAERLTQLKTPEAQGGLGYDTGAKLHLFYHNVTPTELKQDEHWQLAAWAEAGYLYGQTAWANQIMVEIIREQGAVGGFYFDPAQRYVRTIGQAKVLQVLGQFGYRTYTDQISRGFNYLKSLQDASGAFYYGAEDNGTDTVTPWEPILVQDQSIGIIGFAQNLNLIGSNVTKVQDAMNYLMATMKEDRAVGAGFVDADGVEQAQYNGEALQTIYMGAKIGDVDGSGILTSGDALEVLKYSVGLDVPQPGAALAGADRDCSGLVTAGDALIILKNSVGRFNENPSEVLCQ